MKFTANRANMAGKQLQRGHDDYARGDGRGAVGIIRDTTHAGVSNADYLQTTPMSPFIGGEPVRFMGDGLNGCSIDSPGVLGVGRSDPTLSIKRQRKGVDSGRPELQVPTGVIEKPMSAYIGGASGFIDDAHGGYSVNHSLVRSVEGSDPAIGAQYMAMSSVIPEVPFPICEIPLEPMSPYIGGASERLMDGQLSGHPADHPTEIAIGVSNTAVSTKGQSKGVGVGRAKLPVPPDASSTLFVEGLPADRMQGEAVSTKGQCKGVGVGRAKLPVPPDASSTLFVEGLPADCKHREASHIFRPFVGYKELRIVLRKQKHPGAGPLVFCFVDFDSPAHAAAAKIALQGYLFDEYDRDSACLTLEFACNPGPRSGGDAGKKC